MDLLPQQLAFVDSVMAAVAAEPLMRLGRGSGKSTAIRALTLRLEALADMGHEEAWAELGIEPPPDEGSHASGWAGA